MSSIISLYTPEPVPGTVLSSYIKNGAVADPNYSDYNLQISESFFTTDFWYRNKITIPGERCKRS